MLKRILKALAGRNAPDPAQAPAHFSQGQDAAQRGDSASAAEHFAKAVECDPAMAPAYLCLAVAQTEQGLLDEALQAIDNGISIAPDVPEMHITRADVLARQGRLTDAVDGYRRGIEVAGNTTHPIVDEARLSLANALLATSQAAEAESVARDLLKRHPETKVVLLELLARVLLAQNRLRESLECANLILRIDPNNLPALNHRGQVLQKQGEAEKAIATYKKALDLAPDFYQAHCNLGSALEMQRRYTQARAQYEKCLDLLAHAPDSPEYSIASFNLAILDLKEGHFQRGWRRYEHRWNMPSFRENLRDLQQPLWLGDYDLNGHSILLYTEQGLGDTLQFVRYVEPLARAGAHVVLEVQRPLKDLIQYSYGHLVRQVVIRGEALPATDFRCPLMSLPHALGTTMETIPARDGYLRVDPARVARWQEKIQSAQPKIGVVWSGNPNHKADHARSIPLKTLAPLFAARGCQFYILQKDIRDSDRPHMPDAVHVHDLSQMLTDFQETAAIISQLDVVISVDTSVAHLAAALGKPTWVLLPYLSDFRWMLEGAENPWYASARLFRQKIEGDWRAPILEIRKALDEIGAV